MSMKKARIAIALLTVMSAISAAPVQHRGVFIYSTLCEGEEDLAGEQFVVMRLADGAMATYEYTEGALMAPLFAFGPNVQIDERSGHIELRFQLTDSPKPEMVEFTGIITDESLTLQRAGHPQIQLPRVRQQSEKLPSCLQR